MRISYNNIPPFFGVESNEIDKDSFEGFSIQSFVKKNNLNTELIDEEFTWGSRDSNGRFNGVIGRVSNIKINDDHWILL